MDPGFALVTRVNPERVSLQRHALHPLLRQGCTHDEEAGAQQRCAQCMMPSGHSMDSFVSVVCCELKPVLLH